MNEWWDAQTGSMLGGLMGAVGGTLGGLMGAAIGILAPRGRCRRLLIGCQVALTLAGLGLLIAGIVALVVGQPRHVSFPLLLVGAILAAVLGGLMPVTLMRYRQAEQRRLDAEELRRA